MTIARLVLAAAVLLAPQDVPRPVLEQHYKSKSAAELAEWLEQDTRPVYRYRTAIASLLQVKPGMTAVEIGAGSGFVARELAGQVGPEGKVIATELEPKLVAWMREQATAQGLAQFTAIEGRVDGSGLEPASADGILMVNTFSYLQKPEAVLASAAAALKPAGMLVVVDFAMEGSGATRAGIDVEDVIRLATAAGFERVNESSLVPGHYAVRFRVKR
jgi:ubiquinone/menaquinone biosynthesis C-methylase UbiE